MRITVGALTSASALLETVLSVCFVFSHFVVGSFVFVDPFKSVLIHRSPSERHREKTIDDAVVFWSFVFFLLLTIHFIFF